MNPSTALATVVVDELARQGVRDAVLCPGSRSAPFAYALQEADRAGRIRLHVRVDERSAGFLALGLAKLSRRPVPVVTTSGTAVANLHPCVLEASHAQVPVLVISADRPPELRGTGANQTTDHRLFGMAVRRFQELGAPERRPGQQASWRSSVGRLCATATGAAGGDPGPVHLNVPLREPLVPDLAVPPLAVPPLTGAPDWPEPLDGRPGDAPWVVAPRSGPTRAAGMGDLRDVSAPGAAEPSPGSATEGTDRLGGAASVGGVTAVPALSPEPRTLVLLGDLPHEGLHDEVAALARHARWPIVAEPFGRYDRSGVIPHGSLLLTATDWVGSHLPVRVLVVGRVTLSRATAALLRDPRVRVEAVPAGPEWSDPGHVVARVHPWSVLAVTTAAMTAMTATAATRPTTGDAGAGQPAAVVDDRWALEWWEAGRRVATAAGALVREAWPSGLAVASALAQEVPADALVFVGSSNPVRDLDLALDPCRCAPGLGIVASRGLAGIDGAVSTAVGLALSAPGRPAYALMGDLTFLHDANGLLIGPGEPRPDLMLVVPNDDGGGIFSLLEPGEPGRGHDFERIFGTPTGTSVGDLCRAHGVGHLRARTRAELVAGLRRPPAGLQVIEVPLDRREHRDLHERLRAAARRALA